MRLSLLILIALTVLALSAPAGRAQGDLSIRIEVPEINPLGQPLTYTLVVSNAGPFTASRVVVTNQVPSALSSLQVLVCQSNFCHAIYLTNHFIRHEFAGIPAGTAATVEVTGTPTNAERVWFSAGAWPQQFEWEPYNNVATGSLQLGLPDLALFMEPATNLFRAGVPFELRVGVTNSGDSADGVQLITSDNSKAFVAAGHTLSQGEVLELREGIPRHVNFGTVAAGSIAFVNLTLIPKQTGQFSFYSSGSGFGFGFASTNVLFVITEGPGIIEFAAPEANIRESAGEAVLEVRRRDGTEGTVEVSFATQGGTALAGQDYVATSGTLTFAPGETNKTITVPILDDAVTGCNRLLTVRLSNATGGAFLFGTTNATVVILDDDLVPSGSLEAVAIPPNGLETGLGDTAFSSISANGRWLAFASLATNLVLNDSNGWADVFLKDLHTGGISLISVNRSGNRSGDAASWLPTITPDGRHVVFESQATDLTTNSVPTNHPQIYIRDVWTHTTRLVTVTPAGTGADSGTRLIGFYRIMGISTNGQVIAFLNDGNTLANGRPQLLVRNMTLETTTLITAKYDGSGPTEGTTYPTAALNASGSLIVFESKGRDLVEDFSANAFSQIYVRDLIEEETIPITRRYLDGAAGGSPSGPPLITPDGRHVVFRSRANDLVPDDDNPSADIFHHDLATGITRRVSQGIVGPCDVPSVSDDGRFVAFRGGFRPGDPGPIPSPNSSQVYVYDCLSNAPMLVSVNCHGTGPGNRHSLNPTLSANGRYVFFQSLASDLTPGTFLPEVMNLFRRNLIEGTTVLITQNRTLSGGGSFNSGLATQFVQSNLTGDGRTTVVVSQADDLVYEDSNGFIDLFVWRAGEARDNQPRLSISQEDSEVVVRWPNGASDFALQSAPDLSGSAWTNAPATGTNVYRVQPSGGAFFRLKGPE